MLKLHVFEISFSTPSSTSIVKHNEQSQGTQLTFVNDLLSLLATFDSKAENICQRHFSDFMEEILKGASNWLLSDIVVNNKLDLLMQYTSGTGFPPSWKSMEKIL